MQAGICRQTQITKKESLTVQQNNKSVRPQSLTVNWQVRWEINMEME